MPLPESDDPIDLSPLARVGGDPRTARALSRLIRWLFMAAVAFGLVVTWHLAQAAGFFDGRVVSVADGDTITVLDAANTQYRVRLAGIDAPERSQPYGNRSKENLAQLIAGKTVTVFWHKRDQYGRLVGGVYVDGKDVGLTQLRDGLAWWYRRFADEQSPRDRALFEAAERAAKDHALGLWRDPDPIPPWEWRNSQRR